MEEKYPKQETAPKDPKLPRINAEFAQFENSMGSTSVVPVAAPWILPPSWPDQK